MLNQNNDFNGSQLAKMKKVHSLHVPAKNLKSRSSWSKKFQLYLKNYDFREMWNFGNFVKI